MRLKTFFIGVLLIIFIAAFIISIFICFFIEDGYIKIKRSEDPSPIETTEGPAPTALDDDEDESFEEYFVYGTPFLDKNACPTEGEQSSHQLKNRLTNPSKKILVLC